ncbi:hypothetical protein [Lignipirellula cremea]|uniref:Uncharacterized protein n=1 Tax=Lignipirellula cremea TaxID=2528010 RepID=A0A518DYH1_9BACT|nr:hypothetical protein [Lignipirellula cremea]QDU96890.1 hypothetical protein Pla8534_47120 [Lignipirellula cremea]
MTRSINKIVDDLPAVSMTTRVLGALDWVVPGEYVNLVGFENTIIKLTGETDRAWVQKIGDRAITLYNDPKEGYQRSLWLYETVDSIQGVAGASSFISKLAESFSFLSFLSWLTPKADTVQTMDFSVKLVTEVLAFCTLNGLPGDSLVEFTRSLTDARHETRMRLAALVALDGLIPLGPDFMSKVLGAMDRTGVSEFQSNPRFAAISKLMPANSAAEQLSFVKESVAGIEGWANSFVKSTGLTVDKVVDSLKNHIDGIEGKLDYLASFLDMTINYYEHTGVQTVARSLISRAASEI